MKLFWTRTFSSGISLPMRVCPRFFRDAIREPKNEVILSVTAVWETIVKYNLGKLPRLMSNFLDKI